MKRKSLPAYWRIHPDKVIEALHLERFYGIGLATARVNKEERVRQEKEIDTNPK